MVDFINKWIPRIAVISVGLILFYESGTIMSEQIVPWIFGKETP